MLTSEIHAAVRAMSRNKGNLTLGEFIKKLQDVEDKKTQVRFDFGGLVPSDLDSYRGFYDHLALGWKKDYETCHVEDLLSGALTAVGATYTGYKGGEFIMDESTPLWAALYGRSTGTAIVGVTDHKWMVIIDTAYVD